ncbi:MAG TPA: O-antigen ligase family protein, partial [Thermoanaerobaculia bacterium]|nr:O-antigen ligase family protein [Thermoanaerobaculia bacterium]
MTFYEFGKYATGVLAFAAILRYGVWHRAKKLPILYFSLLLPSLAVLPYFDRQRIAFNLSGPFALALAATFLSTVQLRKEDLQWIYLAILGPAIGLAALALSSTLALKTIDFAVSSSETSAGIGADQVSSVLGLGALVAFLYCFTKLRYRFLLYLMAGLFLWLGAQSVLTFARGGLWTMVGAVAVASFYFLRERGSRGALIVRGGLLVVAAVFLVYPFLDQISGGSVSRRFESFNSSGRTQIAQADLEAFEEHPIFGLGPGQSLYFHAEVFRLSNAHTEFSRMLSEHGSFGLAAFVIMLIMAAGNGLKQKNKKSRGLAFSFTAWGLLFMLHSAMRLVAPSFLFGLGMAKLMPEEEPAPRPKRGQAPLAALPARSQRHVRHRRTRLQRRY